MSQRNFQGGFRADLLGHLAYGCRNNSCVQLHHSRMAIGRRCGWQRRKNRKKRSELPKPRRRQLWVAQTETRTVTLGLLPKSAKRTPSKCTRGDASSVCGHCPFLSLIEISVRRELMLVQIHDSALPGELWHLSQRRRTPVGVCPSHPKSVSRSRCSNLTLSVAPLDEATD